MPTKAEDYIAAFERGEEYSPPPDGLIVNDQPDRSAVAVLSGRLTMANPAVREQIVRLLVDLGRRTDTLTPKGADVIRSPEILAALAGPGLVRPDIGREAAMDALRKLATPHDLAAFGGAIVKALEEAPTDEAFLLIAKAKPHGAATLVQRLAALPQWRRNEATLIARAATGDHRAEEYFLQHAAEANKAADGEALGHALGTLGLIGTERSLRVVCEQLRTPLTTEMPGTFERSVRVSVLEALLYNFPDQPTLYPNNILNDDSYAAAEHFCTARLGVTYRDPRPPFLTYRGYPIPLVK